MTLVTRKCSCRLCRVEGQNGAELDQKAIKLFLPDVIVLQGGFLALPALRVFADTFGQPGYCASLLIHRPPQCSASGVSGSRVAAMSRVKRSAPNSSAENGLSRSLGK